MKAKIKFDKQAIQDFFLQHGEKIVGGIAVLVFLVLSYQGLFGRESFSKTPEEMSQGIQVARSHWERTDPDEVIAISPVDYGLVVENGLKNRVSETDYVWPQPPIPARKRSKVGQPGILPLVDLRGAAGVGAVRTASGPQPGGTAAGGGRKGMRWIVLTAKVQNSAQTALFNDHYRKAPFRVPPTEKLYELYDVLRAEVTDSAIPPDQLKWVRLSRAKMLRITQQCGAMPEDVVDDKYLLPSGDRHKLVASLPRLITAQIAGSPGEGPVDAPSPWTRDESAASLPEIRLKHRPGPKPRPAAPSDADIPDGPDGPFTPDDPFNERPPAEPTVTTPEPAVAEPVDDTQFLLFRFLDYSVQPGKRYRYQVCLGLLNPNYGQDTRYLESPALARKRLLQSPYCGPTEEIFVSRDTRLLAGSVKAPSAAQYGVKPKSKVMLVTFDMAQGREAREEIETAARGSMANLQVGGPAEVKVNYITDAMVLDMEGGQRLSGRDRLYSPGGLLLLHANGYMEVRYEMEDRYDYAPRTKPPEPARNEPGRPSTPFH